MLQYEHDIIRGSLLPLCAVLLLIGGEARAQEAAGYGYLQLPATARALALGGTAISVVEPELSLAEQNPALLCREMSGQLALAYTRMAGDASMGYAAYADDFLSHGAWSVGMRYIDYGDFSGYDEWGTPTGSFGVKDMSLQAAVGYPFNERTRIGAQAKMLYSSYESYSAFALGVDVGLNYYDETTGNSYSATLTNLGGQFKALYDGRSESLPTQLNLGWSHELAHLPFCVSVTAYDLLDWDDDFTDGQGRVQQYTDAEKAFNHLIFGLEWTSSEHLWLAASYNYRHQRSFIGQGGFLRGVGLGAGINYRQLAFQLGYATIHAGDASVCLQFDYKF